MAQKTLSEAAENAMWDLFKDHSHEVGSHYAGNKAGKTLTDCITYVKNVLTRAYTECGNAETASLIGRYSEGMPLAKFLVASGWRAHYWNPDVRSPRDSQPEHPVSYQEVKRTGLYYQLRVNGVIIDYNLTRSGGGGCNPGRGKNNDAVFNRVSKVRFAYGLARGGTHTFLYSFGMIYEVHWDKIGEDLYGRTPFYDYPWLSGLLLTPPDAGFMSDPR